MSISNQLNERCSGLCELCGNTATQEYHVSGREKGPTANDVAVCDTCLSAMEDTAQSEHWRCLEGSIWSAEPAVQALSYRLLHSLEEQQWASEVMHSVVPDEDIVQWAMSAFEKAEEHRDTFGNKLENGDTVVLTQALNVKGTSFSAAKGTVVKKIRLVADNTEQIEGKINEQVIVILTKYVKKG